MITTGKLISNSIDNLGRILSKFLGMGKNDIQEVVTSGNFGIDSRAVKDMVAIHAKTSVSGESVVIGFINKDCLSDVGETRLFSTDENGVLQQFIWLKNNGDIHFGGDSDNLTRYGQTSQSINELKNDINDLKNLITSWIPAPGDGGTALKAVLTTWIAQPLIEDISSAKIDEFKTL